MSHLIYIPVVPRLGLTSEERGLAISRELFNLTYPQHLHTKDQTSKSLFLLIKHPDRDEWAIVAKSDYEIFIHPQRDVTVLVSLFPQLTQEERNTLIYYIASNNTVIFENMLPSDAIVLTEAEAEQQGWIENA